MTWYEIYFQYFLGNSDDSVPAKILNVHIQNQGQENYCWDNFLHNSYDKFGLNINIDIMQETWECSDFTSSFVCRTYIRDDHHASKIY